MRFLPIRFRWLVVTAGLLGGLLCLGLSPSFAKEESKHSSKKPKHSQPSLPPIAVLAEVEVGRHPLGVAIDSGSARAVVANRNGKSVSVVDLLGASVLAEVPVGKLPTGVAVNPATDRAVVTLAADHAVAVVNLNSFAVVGRVPVGRKPAGVAVDPGLNLAVVANRNSDSVSIVDLGTLAVTAEIIVGKNPTGVAVNSETHVAAVTNRGDGTVTLLDLTQPIPAVIGVIALPHSKHHDEHDHGKRARPIGVAFDYGPSLNRFVVADPGADSVHIVTLDSSNVLVGIKSLAVGKKPTAVAVNPGNDFALVTSDKDDVFGVTLTAPALVGVADVGKHPRGVAIDPLTCLGVVTNFRDNSVSILAVQCATLQTFSLSPSSVQAGSGSFVLTITGTGFGPGTTVNFGASTGLIPTSITSTQLTITLTAPATPGPVPVSVTRNSQTSNTLTLMVTSGPPPVLTSVSPNSETAEGQSLSLTLRGLNFAPGAVVTFSGEPIPTTFVSSTKITATVPAYPDSSLTLHGGAFPVQVVNPGFGGSSNTLPVSLTNPRPRISLLLPNNATQGSPDFTVIVNGSGFVAASLSGSLVALSQVFFNGIPLAAVPWEPSPMYQLIVTIPSYLLQTPGAYPFLVVNPGPGGGASLAEVFTVYPNVLPPGVTVTLFPIPEGLPNGVAMLGGGVGAVGIQNEGKLRLLDLLPPDTPALIGDAITVTAPVYGSMGDLGANPSTQTLVAALLYEDSVAVVDVSVPTSPTVTKIPVGSLPFGVAVDAMNNRAVVVNEGDGTLSVVNLSTLIADPPISLGAVEAAAFGAVNPVTNVAAVVDQVEIGRGFLLLVDLSTGQVMARIRVGHNPSAVAINPVTNMAVVTNQDDDTISIVNLGTRRVVATVPVGQSPAGVVIDPATNRALITNFLNNQVIAVNLSSLATVTIQLGLDGASAPLDIAWDPAAEVALTTSLIHNNAIIIGLPNAVLP